MVKLAEDGRVPGSPARSALTPEGSLTWPKPAKRRTHSLTTHRDAPSHSQFLVVAVADVPNLLEARDDRGEDVTRSQLLL